MTGTGWNAADGYRHPLYARSLAAFGTPLSLPSSGGWLLRRRIPGTALDDAMGCYPLFCCVDWRGLADDLAELDPALVSVTLVADPFGDHDEALLRRSFDRVEPFKQHHVADLALDDAAIVSRHHRYEVRRARRLVDVRECLDPSRLLDTWTELYAVLARRHRLTGLRAFGRDAFARQLAVPGLRAFVAEHRGTIVGAHLWYVQGPVAYSHLQATNEQGYALGAAYALYAAAIAQLRGTVRWLDLGAGAGAPAAAMDGLQRFKAGWATGSRTAYLCGRIGNAARYAALSRRAAADEPYFPAYRAGELTDAAPGVAALPARGATC